MGIFSEDQKTAISLYIDNLSNCNDIEWFQFEQVSELITSQSNGAREAIEAIRKKLKHGSTQQKLRSLEVLKLLMENSNQRFHRELIQNEKMKERFHIIIETPSEDLTVKKTLLTLLGTWSQKFQNEQGMQILHRLYEQGMATVQRQTGYKMSSDRAGPLVNNPMFDRFTGVQQQTPSLPARPSSANQHFNSQHLYDVPPPNDTRRTTGNSSSVSNTIFDTMKPKIMQEVAIATQLANNLSNALRLINTSNDDWEYNMRRDEDIKAAHQQCEEQRKRIVRYARTVEDEEWIGTLLAANEELLKAINMYDIMLTGQIPAALLDGSGDDKPLQSAHMPRDESGELLEDPFADPIGY